MTDWIEEEPGRWTHGGNSQVWIERGQVTEHHRSGEKESYEGFQVRLAGKPMAVYRRLQDAKRAASLWAPLIPDEA